METVFTVTALVGGVVFAWGAVSHGTEALTSYLFAYLAGLTVVIGSLFVLMVLNATGAGWFVPLRRQCEVVVGALPVVVLGLVPILLWLDPLYAWVHPHELEPALARHHVEDKLVWLNPSAFTWRSVGYALIFALLAECLLRWSFAQDRTKQDAADLRRKIIAFSTGSLVIGAVVLTLAAWDWIMSLDPAWYSDAFGVYVFAGAFVAALGLLGAMAVRARGRGDLPERVGSSHYHALGRLELAMLVFWAYIGWAHVLQQWIANVPAEQLWYIRRWSGGWQWQGLVLIGVHFVLPFFPLLFKSVKRSPRAFGAISLWLVAVHALDIHYLVVPALRPRALSFVWLDVAALALVLGVTGTAGALRARGRAALALNDPLLESGLAYESAS